MPLISPSEAAFLPHPTLPKPSSLNHPLAPTCALLPSHCSRRSFLTLVSLTPFFLKPPSQAAEPPPQLPPGAREFSRLLSAQKQWAQLIPIFSSGRQLEPSEWDSLRGYLRSIYAVSGDMEFLSKAWNATLKTQGLGIAKQFRTVVKGMDQPAIDQDVERFARMHAEASQLLEQFFAVLKEASVGDIPDEL